MMASLGIIGSCVRGEGLGDRSQRAAYAWAAVRCAVGRNPNTMFFVSKVNFYVHLIVYALGRSNNMKLQIINQI